MTMFANAALSSLLLILFVPELLCMVCVRERQRQGCVCGGEGHLILLS